MAPAPPRVSLLDMNRCGAVPDHSRARWPIEHSPLSVTDIVAVPMTGEAASFACCMHQPREAEPLQDDSDVSSTIKSGCCVNDGVGSVPVGVRRCRPRDACTQDDQRHASSQPRRKSPV